MGTMPRRDQICSSMTSPSVAFPASEPSVLTSILESGSDIPPSIFRIKAEREWFRAKDLCFDFITYVVQ